MYLWKNGALNAAEIYLCFKWISDGREPAVLIDQEANLLGDIVDKELDIQNSMKLILIIVTCLTLGGAFVVFYRNLFYYLLFFLPWFTTFPSLFKCSNWLVLTAVESIVFYCI